MIREATQEDRELVLELARWFMRTSSYSQFQGPPAQLEQLFLLVLEHGVIYVSEDQGGELDGFIALVAVPHPFNGEFYAEEVAWFVRPDRRGGSTGPRLLAAAEEWTRQKDLFALKMSAPVDTPTVGRFYQRSGYEAIETAYMKRV